MKVQETDVQTDRILTLPNIISFVRLLGVPVFLWLILVPQADGWALVVLVLSGISDWADGKIARATGQISRLGQILDPVADRLYIAGMSQRKTGTPSSRTKLMMLGSVRIRSVWTSVS